MIHELKTWTEYFQAIVSGEKTFEIRENDRGFRVGDTLILRQWTPCDKCTCGLFNQKPCQECGGNQGFYGSTSPEIRIVTYILSGMGLRDGFVALALSKPKP